MGIEGIPNNNESGEVRREFNEMVWKIDDLLGKRIKLDAALLNSDDFNTEDESVDVHVFSTGYGAENDMSSFTLGVIPVSQIEAEPEKKLYEFKTINVVLSDPKNFLESLGAQE